MGLNGFERARTVRGSPSVGAHLAFLLTAQAEGRVIHWQDNLVLVAHDDSSSNRTPSGSTFTRQWLHFAAHTYPSGPDHRPIRGIPSSLFSPTTFEVPQKSFVPLTSSPLSSPNPLSLFLPLPSSHRGQTTNRSEKFPEISPTADVTLFEGGYWAASFCRQPLKALRVHLKEFARWALTAAPAKGRVIFRTIPSFPVAGEWCQSCYPGPRSNRVVMAINALLKQIVQGGIEKLVYLDSSLQVLPEDSEEEGGNAERASPTPSPSPSPPPPSSSAESAELAALPAGAAIVLDTWQVDGPRYADTAVPNDHHYSVVKLTNQGAVVTGDVGEAQVRVFIHYLLHLLPPLRGSPRCGSQQKEGQVGETQVDGPRYADTAVPNDHHYSVVKLTDQGAVVTGDVGEVQVRAFIHYLLHGLPPLHP
ncbi:unnamed protein product [Closterium sp. NIES-65]|nr:unnamed protein product [Closterium sp. NIES-65]